MQERPIVQRHRCARRQAGETWRLLVLSALATLAAQPDKIRECFCMEDDDESNCLARKAFGTNASSTALLCVVL